MNRIGQCRKKPPTCSEACFGGANTKKLIVLVLFINLFHHSGFIYDSTVVFIFLHCVISIKAVLFQSAACSTCARCALLVIMAFLSCLPVVLVHLLPFMSSCLSCHGNYIITVIVNHLQCNPLFIQADIQTHSSVAGSRVTFLP